MTKLVSGFINGCGEGFARDKVAFDLFELLRELLAGGVGAADSRTCAACGMARPRDRATG
jgi:hypothetical protein